MSKGFCSAEQGKRTSGAGPLALHPIPRSGKTRYLGETLTEIGTYNGVRSATAGRDSRGICSYFLLRITHRVVGSSACCLALRFFTLRKSLGDGAARFLT